jgi:branched-chain amino acid transport system permease protein
MLTAGVIWQAICSGILNGGIYALIALTLAIMLGVMRIMNFAHGDLLMVAMYGIVVLNHQFGLHPYVGAVAMIPVMGLLGWVLYRLLIQRAMTMPLLTQAQLTVGLSFAIQSLALIVFGADLLNVKTSLDGAVVHPFGVVIGVPTLVGFATSLGVCMLVSGLLFGTEGGAKVRAIAQDDVMSRLCGISVPAVRQGTFIVCVALLAIPAGALMAFSYVTPFAGIHFTLISLLIVVLGGIGDVKATFIAAMLIGVTESLASALLNNAAAPAVVYVLFGLGLLFRPQGILGRGSRL